MSICSSLVIKLQKSLIMKNIFYYVLYIQMMVLVFGREIGQGHENIIEDIYEDKLWPNAVIPYELKDNFNTIEVHVIMDAVHSFHKSSCVRWVRRSTEDSYVVFSSAGNICMSELGRQGGPQVLSIGRDRMCINYGTILHEMMHAAGFQHEHNRPDRDEYITIVEKNIDPAELQNFEKINMTEYNDFGFPYDYNSIMHYRADEFSYNGGNTIIPKKKGVTLNEPCTFSATDIKKINVMYKCKKS